MFLKDLAIDTQHYGIDTRKKHPWRTLFKTLSNYRYCDANIQRLPETFIITNFTTNL